MPITRQPKEPSELMEFANEVAELIRYYPDLENDPLISRYLGDMRVQQECMLRSGNDEKSKVIYQGALERAIQKVNGAINSFRKSCEHSVSENTCTKCGNGVEVSAPISVPSR